MKQIIFICICTIYFQTNLCAQKVNKTKFHRLPDGISNNLVSCVFQDSKGFLWFGTANGLNKFDGYKYTTYEHTTSDSNSIRRNLIMHIYEDKTGNFWISTEGGGLNYFDRKTEKFKFYRQGNDNKHLSSDMIRMILEDTDGTLWLAHSLGLDNLNPKTGIVQHFSTNQPQTKYASGDAQAVFRVDEKYVWLTSRMGGLVRFDKQNKIFVNFSTQNSEIKDNFIRAITPSKEKNKYWVGYQRSGVSLISIQGHKVIFEKHYTHNPQNPQTINGNNIRALLEDSKGNLWIGIENGGISILNLKSDTINHYKNDNKDELSLASDSPWVIYEDGFGNIWIGTYDQGVNVVYNEYYEKFEHYAQQGDNKSLANNNVSCFIETKDKKIWIGTDGGGISAWDRSKNIFNTYNIKSNLKTSSNAIISVGEDKKGNLWFGTWEGGLNVYNPNTESFNNYTTQNKNFFSNTHFDLISAKDGKLYLLSWENNLDVFDVDKKEVSWTKNFSDKNINIFYRIFEDSNENIWIGTAQGLILIDKNNRSAKGDVKIFKNQENQKNSLSDNAINDIYEDSKGNIWIGTINGLNRYIPSSQSFRVYSKKDGLINEDVKAIIEDNQNNFWITTNRGVSRFDLKKEVFENYSREDGLQGNEFSRGAIYKTNSGEILMGGKNGFNIFNPEKLRKNPFLPKVFFTNFTIFNKEVIINEKNSPLKSTIELTQEIILNHTQSIFTLDFVALNYTRPEKNQYAYKLEGFEKDWNYVGNKREATYTSLPAGEYIFRVKATNNDGEWSKEEAKLKLIILPPWWKTLWFRSLVTLLILSIAFTFYKIRTDFLKKQNHILERQVHLRTEEISTQNEELRQNQEEILTQRDFIQEQNAQLFQQNQLVQEKSRQIHQSINAALTIQQAILPHEGKITRLLGEHFVIYNPKDVVSGDFYWLTEQGNKIVMVVADCTGHGVPGAFMTLIGNTLLDKIVKVMDITHPAKILNQLHLEIYKALKQKHINNNYGMDAITITNEKLEDDTHKITFSGAKNSIYYVNAHHKEEVFCIKGSRRAIGGHQNEQIKFVDHEIVLPKGSMIYLGSDGYIDQNDIKRRKFGSDNFTKLIQSSAHLPFHTQKTIFEMTMEEYKRETDQRDDILLVGFKI